MRIVGLGLLVGLVCSIAPRGLAGEARIGHRSSLSQYRGDAAVGRSLKVLAKAGADGNPAQFPMPILPPCTTRAAPDIGAVKVLIIAERSVATTPASPNTNACAAIACPGGPSVSAPRCTCRPPTWSSTPAG